jgi:hypothetical protein
MRKGSKCNSAQIEKISCHDDSGINRNRQFNQVVVGLVFQIAAPQKVNPRPFTKTKRQKAVEQHVSLSSVQAAPGK